MDRDLRFLGVSWLRNSPMDNSHDQDIQTPTPAFFSVPGMVMDDMFLLTARLRT
jgi:hypothetical protein